jgi:hypothetical protein
VAPVIHRLTLDTHALLDEDLQGFYGGSAYIFVTNTGRAPGSYEGVSLNSHTVTHGMDDVRTLKRFSIQPLILQPGEAKQIVVPLTPDVWTLVDAMFMKVDPDARPELFFQVDRGGLNVVNPAVAKDLPFAWTDIIAAGPTEWHKCIGAMNGERENADDPASNILMPETESIATIQAPCGNPPDVSPAGGGGTASLGAPAPSNLSGPS